MSCGVNTFLFLGTISAIMTRFFTTVASALTGLILGILASVVLQAVLLILVLSSVAVGKFETKRVSAVGLDG